MLTRPVSRLSRLLSSAQPNKVTTGLVLVLSSMLVAITVGSSISALTFKIAEEKAERQARIAEIAEAEAECSQYTSNTQAANSFLRGNDKLLVRKVVENAPAEHRNFKWALLANLAEPKYPVGKYSTPFGQPIAVALSSDGSRLGALTVSSRCTVGDYRDSCP